MVRPEGDPSIKPSGGSRFPIIERVGRMVSSVRGLWHNLFAERPYLPRTREDVLGEALKYSSRRLGLPRMARSVDDLMEMVDKLPKPEGEIKHLSDQEVRDILQGLSSEEKK